MDRLTALICLMLIGCAGLDQDPPDQDREPADLLIVTTDSLLRCAERIAVTRTGYDTSVMTMPEIADPQAGAVLIDDLIEDYALGHDRVNVLLVGIHQILPGHEFAMDILGETTWSDRPYVELADGRTVPVGRIPVANDQECDEYLNPPAGTGVSDRNTIVFYGNEPEISYARLYDADYARELGFGTVVLVSPDADRLAEAFAGGDVLAVFYYGHGSYYGNGALTADNAADILPPGIIHVSGGCGFGQAPPDRQGLSETIVNRLGGTAIGATDFGGLGYGYRFVQEVLYHLNKTDTTGELMLRSVEGYGEIEQPSDRVDTLKDRFVLYGDPTRPF